jgi:hypothetical protein
MSLIMLTIFGAVTAAKIMMIVTAMINSSNEKPRL